MDFSLNLKATFILTFCILVRVYDAKNSKLEQKVDALDKLFRSEMYLINEKVETGRQERDMILEQLNQTLDHLENSASDERNKEGETHIAISEANLKPLLSKISGNNMVVDQLSKSLIRIKRGLLDEKKARKNSAHAVIKQLNIIQERQTEILKNQADLASGMLTIIQVRQTEILKNQADLASGITDIFSRIDTLENTTNLNSFQSENIQLSLNEGLSKLKKEFGSTTQNLTTVVDVIAVQIKDVKENVAPVDQTNLNDSLQIRFTEMEDHLKQIKSFLPAIKLQGGGLYQGRVEINYMGRIGTVCDDDWDDDDARVVCRMLGFSGGTAFYGPRNSLGHQYGAGTGDILLDNVQCSGSEDTLFQCKHNGLGVENCSHNEDAGVRCNP